MGAKAAASQERFSLQEEHIAVLQVRLGKMPLLSREYTCKAETGSRDSFPLSRNDYGKHRYQSNSVQY